MPEPCLEACDKPVKNQQPTPVFVCGSNADEVPQIDVETHEECRDGVLFIVTTVFTDGVAGTPTEVDTGYECDPAQMQYDLEKIERCVAGLKVIEICRFITDTDGVTTKEVFDTVATGQPCEDPNYDLVSECRNGIVNVVTYLLNADGTKTEIEATPTTEICIEALEPIIEIDTEYICNTDTNVYDQHVIITTDGVAASPVITPTTTSCDEEKPDFEPVIICRNGTEHAVTFQYDEDGTQTELSAIDTGKDCTDPVKQTVTVDTCDGTEDVAVDSEVAIRGVVTVKQCPEDVVKTEVDYECNDNTGFLQQIVTVITNGTPATPTITDTTTECSAVDESKDFEQVKVCNDVTGFYDVVTTIFLQDETSTKLTVATTEECNKSCPTPFQKECLKKRTIKVGYDNGVTPGSSTNTCGARPNFIRFSWEFEVVGWDVNGGTVGAGDALGPFTQWTPQLQGWADFFNANNPNTTASAAFGFDPKPTWRFAEITDCNPSATYGPLQIQRVDTGCVYTVYPILESEEYTTIYKYSTLDCDGNTETIYEDESGNVIAEPSDIECYVPCSQQLGEFIEGEESNCETKEYTGCDDADGTQIISLVTDCDGTRTTETYTLDSYLNAQSPDDLVVHVIAGQFVDCETGDPVVGCGTDNGYVEKLCDCTEGDNCIIDTCNIYSPVKADSNGTAFNVGTPITNHIDKSGLLTPFTDGQDFVAYDPANQAHVTTWNGNETYLELSTGITATTPLVITYDMGFIGTFNKIAFWTEESHPACCFDVEYSLDGTTWTASQSYTIPEQPITGGYGANVLDIDCAFTARFIRFNHTDSSTYRPTNDLLAIGEIAFGGTDTPPEENFKCVEFYREHTANGYCDYTLVKGVRTPYVPTGEVGQCPDECCEETKALLQEIVENTEPAVDCESTLTSELLCVQGDQTVTMADGSTRTLTDGSYVTVVQEFDCIAQLITVKYYETSNPDSQIDISGGAPTYLDACEPAPIGTERCIVDAKGVQWIVTEYRDEDGIVVGTPFYLQENGSIGIPAGDPKEWTTCSDCCPTIESREVCVKTDDGIVAGLAVVEVTDVATKVLRIEDAIGTALVGDIVPCECPCEDVEEPTVAKQCVRGFDYQELSTWDAGDGIKWQISKDGVSVANVFDDVVAQDNGNKSSWYTNMLAAVNAIAGVSVTVVTDAVSTQQGPKPVFEFSIPAGCEVEIVRNGGDTLTLTGNADGTVTGTFEDGGNNIASETFVEC